VFSLSRETPSILQTIFYRVAVSGPRRSTLLLEVQVFCFCLWFRPYIPQ
jgi:hypothetical protein